MRYVNNKVVGRSNLIQDRVAGVSVTCKLHAYDAVEFLVSVGTVGRGEAGRCGCDLQLQALVEFGGFDAR